MRLDLALSACIVLPLLGCSSDDGDPEATANGSSGDSSDDRGESDDTDTSGSCVSFDFVGASVQPGDSLIDIAVGDDVAWVLLRGDGGVLAVSEIGGQRRVLEAGGATGAAISAVPESAPCVLWGVGGEGAAMVKTACAPGFDVVDTGLAIAISSEYPVAYRDEGPRGAAVSFAESNSLDGLLRDELGQWEVAVVNESSISAAGGPRALSGTVEGAPYCFNSQGRVVVERWLRSGSFNDIGVIETSSTDQFSRDVGCGVATRGEVVGVFAVGGGEATFAVRGDDLLAQLVESPLDAQMITGWGFGATAGHFVAAYASGGGLFRAQIPVEGGAPEVSSVALPSGVTASRNVALTHGSDGAEYIALDAEGEVLVAKACAEGA